MEILLAGSLISLAWLAAAWLELRLSAPGKNGGEQLQHWQRHARRRQAELVEQYMTSPLTGRVLAAVRAGEDGILPGRIVIEHTRIILERPGGGTVLDLGQERFSKLTTVFLPREEFGLEEEDYFPKPQAALAEALNRHLGGAYRICDFSERRLGLREDGRLWVEYMSNRVEMRLK